MQCELVFRLPAGENCDEWNVACAGCDQASLEKPDENTWRLELSDADIEDIATVPVFIVQPYLWPVELTQNTLILSV